MGCHDDGSLHCHTTIAISRKTRLETNSRYNTRGDRIDTYKIMIVVYEIVKKIEDNTGITFLLNGPLTGKFRQINGLGLYSEYKYVQLSDTNQILTAFEKDK